MSFVVSVLFHSLVFLICLELDFELSFMCISSDYMREYSVNFWSYYMKTMTWIHSISGKFGYTV